MVQCVGIRVTVLLSINPSPTGDKDNWIGLVISGSMHAIAVHLNNEEDKNFITTKLTIKGGLQPKVKSSFSIQ